jgi:hypothetical protein
MRSTLIVDRRRLDDALNRARYLVEVNYGPETFLKDEQREQLPNAVYEGFAYYLEMLYSHVMGGPNVEFILDEYLHGELINPHNRGVVIFELGHIFRTAADLVRGDLSQLTSQVESRFEDITDMQFLAPGQSKLGVFMVESESVLGEDVEINAGRGLTQPTGYTLL